MTADAQAAFASYKDEALAAIASASSEDALELVRVEFLGKKRGRLKELQSLLGQADPEQRPLLGKSFNQVQAEVRGALEERQGVLARPVAAVAAIDVTLPGSQPVIGRRHPITKTMEDFKDIVGRMGFRVATGPGLEDDHHNLVSLNIPPEHPARDPLGNFYLATALAGTGGDEAALFAADLFRIYIRSVSYKHLTLPTKREV